MSNSQSSKITFDEMSQDFDSNKQILNPNSEAVVYITNRIDTVFFDYISSIISDIDYYVVINTTNKVESEAKNIVFYNRPYASDKSDSESWIYGLSKIKESNIKYKKISFCKRDGEISGVLHWSL